MRVCPLAAVKDRIVLGQALPFSVRDNSRVLLLAKGQVIQDANHLADLFRRGAVVDASELVASVKQRQEDPALRMARLPSDWSRTQQDVRQALSAEPSQLAAAVDNATGLLLELIDCAPEVALSQIVRQPESMAGHYGVSHSIHAATACLSAARYLGWDPTSQRRAFQAALTMNLGMLDLQARLSSQVSPLSQTQRDQIQNHPLRSVEMLGAAGVVDSDWLQAVLQHHELPDGSGYPRGITDVAELAEMLRFADVYTARLAARATREAMSAMQAGRELHQMADASPLASALIKAFGIFPPGTLVKLASGEMGLVVKNGEKAHQPFVSVLTNTNGEPRMTPATRDTSIDSLRVVSILPIASFPVRLSDERIAALIGAAG